jgi:hypothetical protein
VRLSPKRDNRCYETQRDTRDVTSCGSCDSGDNTAQAGRHLMLRTGLESGHAPQTEPMFCPPSPAPLWRGLVWLASVLLPGQFLDCTMTVRCCVVHLKRGIGIGVQPGAGAESCSRTEAATARPEFRLTYNARRTTVGNLACFRAGLYYCSNLKMEAPCSSETSVHIKRTIRRYIPQDKKFPDCKFVNALN